MAIMIDMDMPMPDNCEDCGALGLYDVTMCKEAKFTIFMHEAKRPNQCPLREVVRCKDCKRYESDGGALMICTLNDMIADDDCFCWWGERKEE